MPWPPWFISARFQLWIKFLFFGEKLQSSTKGRAIDVTRKFRNEKHSKNRRVKVDRNFLKSNHHISTSEKHRQEWQLTFHDGVENRTEFLEKSDGRHTVYESMVQGENKRTLSLLDSSIRSLHFAEVVTPSKTFWQCFKKLNEILRGINNKWISKSGNTTHTCEWTVNSYGNV